MGDLAIYTYGGGHELWKVFNGMALVFASSNPYLTSVVKLTFIIGTVWAACRAIYNVNVGIFAKQWFVPSFILLNIVLLPKVSVHIIDKVDANFAYSKVDNVPFGAAFVASTMSKIAVFLSDTIETAWSPVESVSYNKTGMMFAAKLVEASSRVRLTDPITRDNIKTFLNRCYIWPFIFSNVKGLEKEARSTNDILGFIGANPHPSLGMYWRYPDGHTEFKYCKDCLTDVKEAMNLEVPVKIGTLAKNLLSYDSMRDRQGEQVTQRLKTYFPDAWERLAGYRQNAHEVLSQQLMLNAARESLDDQRERFGAPRLWPHLIGMESAKIQAQQTLMETIRGDMAGSWIPTLQTILFALLLLMFMLVIPMTFLPGGFQMLRTWTKLMMWIQLWPVFSTFLHCLGMMYAAKAGTAFMQTHDFSLNLTTQTGLADLAHHAVAWVNGLQLSVPFLSWAVISGSDAALTGLASSHHQALDSGAARASTEIMEGTIGFDNQNFHNRSVGIQQYARQEIGPKVDFSRTLDTGSLIKTTNPMTGEADYHQRTSSLKSHFGLSDSLSGDLSEAHAQAISATATQEKSFTDSMNVLNSTGKSFFESVSQGRIYNKSWSEDENRHYAQTAQNFLSQSNQASKDQSVSAGSEAKTSIGAGLMALSAETSLNYGKQEHLQSSSQSSEGKHYQEDVSRLIQMARQGSLTGHTSADQNKTEEFRQAYENTKQASEHYQAALTRSQNLETATHIVEIKGIQISQNITDDILNDVARGHYGGNKDLAVQEMSHNPEKFNALAAPYLKERKQKIIEGIANADHRLSEGEMTAKFNQLTAKTVTPHVQEHGLNRNIGGEVGDAIHHKGPQQGEIKRDLQGKEAQHEAGWERGLQSKNLEKSGLSLDGTKKIPSSEQEIRKKHNDQKSEHEKEYDKTSLRRGVEGVAGDFSSIATPIVEGYKKSVDNAGFDPASGMPIFSHPKQTLEDQIVSQPSKGPSQAEREMKKTLEDVQHQLKKDKDQKN